MQAPKEKRNEQMSLAHRKYFVNFIRSGGNYKSFRAEYLRIFKKETSRSTFTRLKRDSEKILNFSYFFRISRKFQKCVTFKHVTFTHDSVPKSPFNYSVTIQRDLLYRIMISLLLTIKNTSR